MKPRFLIAIAALCLSTLAPACSCDRVPTGFVGVLVHTMGSERGDLEAVGVGRYILGPTEDLYTFPTFKQTETWQGAQEITFQTKEGLTVKAAVGMTYSVEPDKAVDLFKTYRRGIGEISDLFLRNHVRDAMNVTAASLSVEAVYGEGKAKMIEDVTAMVREKVGPLGIIVDDVYIIGNVDLPEAVTAALNAKLTATQRAQQRENELRESEAEAKKVEAAARGVGNALLVEAEAQAKANELLSKSITPNLVQIKAIEKWDGRLPVVGSSGGSMIQLPATLLK